MPLTLWESHSARPGEGGGGDTCVPMQPSPRGSSQPRWHLLTSPLRPPGAVMLCVGLKAHLEVQASVWHQLVTRPWSSSGPLRWRGLRGFTLQKQPSGLPSREPAPPLTGQGTRPRTRSRPAQTAAPSVPKAPGQPVTPVLSFLYCDVSQPRAPQTHLGAENAAPAARGAACRADPRGPSAERRAESAGAAVGQ